MTRFYFVELLVVFSASEATALWCSTNVLLLLLLLFIINSLIDHIRRDQKRKRMHSSDFITVPHTITSFYPIIPQSLWLAAWSWLLERLRHSLMGVAYKNIAMKSDFSQMRPSRSGFDWERI